MKLLQPVLGVYRVRLVSADVPSVLCAVHKEGIQIFDVKHSDVLSVEITVPRRDLPALQRLSERRGDKTIIISQHGLYRIGKAILNRPLLLVFMVVLLLLTIFLPSRILFIEVEGNAVIPSRYILEQAEHCGIIFGASRRHVRSEDVKNALMESIPGLSWVGVNTNGFVATISVKEKNITDEKKETNRIQSIVASRDGIVVDITTTNGSAVCRVGQAVKAGQLLISGYEDLGILVRGTKASGEIIAQTMRELTVISPACSQIRGAVHHTEKKYSLIFGKKQIKLYKDSGISDTSCVKIYHRADMTLPGDLSLPVSLVTEEWIYYDMQTVPVSQESFDWITSYSREYLSTQMVAGTFIAENSSLQLLEDACLMIGRYTCLEMIGQVRNEEIINYYGKDN